jgi:hypothetical protein
MKALDKMGEILKKKGLRLEALIESGREIRGKLLLREYGLQAKPNKQ